MSDLNEVPPPIPDHTLLRRIGGGSSGQVWLARSAIGTYHGVKIIHRSNFKDAAPFLRELKGIRKFEPISRSHPGFVNILHVGQEETKGYFYCIMELADDVEERPAFDVDAYRPKSLEVFVGEGRNLSPDQVLTLGLRLSDAVQALHEAGLVHRDIKPANLLFVAGRPKLADIGLVTDANCAESMVGTPGYIPEEGPGTEQADVYALGKVLYECLTGLDRSRFPELPTFFGGHPDHKRFLELNEIIVRACDRSVQKRYQSARQLHAELTVIENGESVIHLRSLERKIVRIKKMARRGAVALLVLLMGGFVLQREAWHREQVHQREVGSVMASSIRAVDDGDYAKGLQDAARLVALSDSKRSEMLNRLRFGSILGQMPKLTLLQALNSPVHWCAFTEDDSGVRIGLADGRCQIRSASSGKVLLDFVGHTNAVTSLAISSDGQLIASSSYDRTVRIWDAGTGRCLRVLPHGAFVTWVDFQPGGYRLVSSCANGQLTLWDAENGNAIRTLAIHKGAESVRFSHGGNLLASVGRDGTARVWDAKSGDPIGEALSHQGWVFSVSFSPDDRRLLTACSEQAAFVWSVQNNLPALPPLRHERGVHQAEFCPDGRSIATAGWDGAVCFWDATTGERESPLLRHSSPVSTIGFSSHGNKVVTGCTDGTLRIWDRAGRTLPRQLRAQALSPTGTHFAKTNKNSLEVFDLQSIDGIPVHIPTPGPIHRLSFCADGSHVGVVQEHKRENVDDSELLLSIFRVADGKPVSPAIPLPNATTEWVCDRGSLRLALVDSNSVSVLEIATGKQLFPMVVKDHPVTNAVFSPDGRSLAIITRFSVELHSVVDGTLLFPPLLHEILVKKVVFNPYAEQIVTCTADPMLRACYAQRWNLRTGKAIGEKLWHGDGVNDAAWCMNGKRLITVGEDGVGRIWLAENGRSVGVELHHRHEIGGIKIGGWPELALTTSLDKTLRLWDPETGLPVTAPYQHSYYMSWANFTSVPGQLVVQELGFANMVQQLDSPRQPTALLSAIADVLAGRSSMYGTADEFKSADILAAQWNQLRTTWPEGMTTSNEDLERWHHYEFGKCYAVKDRRGELFHVNDMLRLLPGNARLIAYKAMLEEQISLEQTRDPEPVGRKDRVTLQEPAQR